jgi:hypothetical protein
MSVEQKIKELLNRTTGKQQLAEESQKELAEGEIIAAANKAAVATKKDTSKAAQASTAGDASNPMQGSSEKASFTSHDEDDTNPGAKSAASISKAGLPDSKGDAKSVKTPAMEEEQVEGEAITEEEVDISTQLNSIFGEELSEDFKTKATSIFEAAVIARVNSEMEKVTAKLEEQTEATLQEYKDHLVEKVDSYLNYVVEQWMEENQLAVESGLRTEIAEDFITGLKTLFKEHYIEVPEEKYNVLEDLEQKATSLEGKLDEEINKNIAIAKELSELKAAKIFEEQTKDLAATEVEKLKKLMEGVDFENEELYREKVSVIKENYFPKGVKSSPEKVLVEEAGTNPAAFADNSSMNKYVQALSRTLKTR